MRKQIIHNIFKKALVRDIYVTNNEVSGAFIRVYYDELYIFDGFGHLLYQGTQEIHSISSGINNEGKHYVKLYINPVFTTPITYDEVYFYVYDALGNMTRVATDPAPNTQKESSNAEDLSEYGLPLYSLVTNEESQEIKDATGKTIVTLKKEVGVYRSQIFAGHYFYQKITKGSKSAINYDLKDIYGNTYKVSTHSVNLKTGRIKTLKFPYFLAAISPLRDKNNIYNYAVAEIATFDAFNSKTANYVSEKFIINYKGHLLDQVSDMPLENFVEIQGGFYNKATNKLYDEDVKLIKEFKDFTSSIVLAQQGLIIGTKDGKDGVINARGDEVIPFIYDKIFDSEKEGYMIANKSNMSYRIKLATNEATSLSSVVTKAGNEKTPLYTYFDASRLYPITVLNEKEIVYQFRIEGEVSTYWQPTFMTFTQSAMPGYNVVLKAQVIIDTKIYYYFVHFEYVAHAYKNNGYLWQ